MSNLNLARIGVLPVVVLIASVFCYGQGVHTLQGKVMLANGASPPNPVRVSLTYNSVSVYETFTDLSGRFSFTGLHRGMYQLTAEGDDRTFETTRVNAEISAYGSAPQTFTQNIQLRVKAGKAIPAAGVTSAEAADPNVPRTAREAYDKGVKRAQDDKPEQAIKSLQEAIAAYPQFYSAHIALGEQYDKLKRYAEAEAVYQEAIKLRPDRADAHVGLGVVLVKQKKYAEAIPPLRRSIEMEKQSSPPYLFLGLAEMMTADYQSAEVDLLRAYEIGKPTIAHIYLANLYDLLHQPTKAIEQLQAFLKENPESPSSRQIREAIDKLRKQTANKK
jgi:tetratricopeptide (TPR) repeat protein